MDIGAVLPLNSFDRYSTTGFVLAPWLGYMFNPYIGVMAQAQGLVAPNRSRGISFEEVSAALAGAVGPRVEVPLGPLETLRYVPDRRPHGSDGPVVDHGHVVGLLDRRRHQF